MLILSIIIPVYNVESYLSQCLDSVLQVYNAGLNQYGEQWMNLICVDDGSTDGSADILREFCQQHPFASVESVSNGGAGYARNIGLKKAKGEFVYFLDSDDFLFPETFLGAIQYLKSDMDILCCNADYGKGKRLMKDSSFDAINGSDFCQQLFSSPAHLYYPCQLWVYFYRRVFLEKHSIAFPEGIVCEDEEFTWLAMSYAQKSLKRDILLLYHRQNREGSVMSVVSEKHIWALYTVTQHLFNQFLNRTDIGEELRHALFELKLQILRQCKERDLSYALFYKKEDRIVLKKLAFSLQEKRTYFISKFSVKLAIDYYYYKLNRITRKMINLLPIH